MRVDTITALFLIAASAIAYFVSMEFPEGAQLFPQLLAYAIGFLALIILIVDLRKAARGADQMSPSKGAPAQAYVTYAMAVVYVVGIQVIGFFVSTVIMATLLMMYLGVRKPTSYALAISAMVLFYWALFDRFLHVPLPRGLLY